MSASSKRSFGRSTATAVQDSTATDSVEAASGSNAVSQNGADRSNGSAPAAAAWSETTTTLPPVGSGQRLEQDVPVDPYSATTVTPAAGSGATALDASAPTVRTGGPAAAASTQPAQRPTPAPSTPPKVATVPKRADRAPRRAKLQVRHLNVWSVLKFSCVLALALFLVWMTVIAVLYGVLDHMHVFAKIDETVQKINGDAVQQHYVTRNIVFGAALLIGLVNTVLFIVLSTIGSIVYNLCADLVGGVEVTLAERE